MSRDPLVVLAAANPVPALPDVPPVERLPRAEEELAAVDGRRRFGPLPRALLAMAALAGTAVGLVLASAGSGPGVDVVAAAYAATSPPSGVIEAEFIVRSPHLPAMQPIRHREWVDASTGRRRQQDIRPNGTVVSEVATQPGWVEIWEEAGRGGKIFRLRDRPSVPQTRAPQGLALYRRLYEDRHIRVVGHERFGGRSMWKLEGAVAFSSRATGAPAVPLFGEVVLVDPRTYLPVVEREVNLALAGHPVIVETRLVSYRYISAADASGAVMRLSAAHPDAEMLGGGAKARRPGAGGHVRRNGTFVRVRLPF